MGEYQGRNHFSRKWSTKHPRKGSTPRLCTEALSQSKATINEPRWYPLYEPKTTRSSNQCATPTTSTPPNTTRLTKRRLLNSENQPLSYRNLPTNRRVNFMRAPATLKTLIVTRTGTCHERKATNP